MKKFIVAVMFGLMSLTAFAEATFEQIEGLIQQQQYSSAAAGLEVIIQNHPKSAKAFYAMAQAQAGMGNLEKAKKALDIATGLNPALDFAPASSVASLRQAITPQTAKIEAVEETHFWRNFAYFALFAGFAVACYFLYSVYARKQEQEQAEKAAKEAQWAKEMDEAQARHDALKAEREEARRVAAEAEAALKSHKNYGHERFDPSNPDKLKTIKQVKEEKAAAELREAHARAERAEADARMARSYSAPQPTTTVVNNSGNDMLTGVLIGNMLSSHHDHHDTTVVRETVREVPSKSSTWDDTPAPSRSSRSSTWDDTPSKSSSWDSDSDTKSSSSWSSSSSSSSSWDSGSSSSDSGSSSSWD